MPTTFSIEFSPQLRDVRGRFARAEGDTLDQRVGQLSEGLRNLVRLMRNEAPKRTGDFASRIAAMVFMRGNRLEGEITSPSPLSEIIQRGSRPHTIRPRNARALAFPWENGPRGAGVYVFKSVHHPGTHPNPFMERAVRIWMPDASETLNKMALSFQAFLTQ